MNPRAGPPALPSNRLIHAKYFKTLTLCVSRACSSNTLPYPEAKSAPVPGSMLINYFTFNGLTPYPYGYCSLVFADPSPYPEANLGPLTTALPDQGPPKTVRTLRQGIRTSSKAVRTPGQRSPYPEATRSVPPGNDLRTPRQGSPYPEATDRDLNYYKQSGCDHFNSFQVFPTPIPQHSTAQRSKSTTSSVPMAPTPRFVVVWQDFFYQKRPCL